MRLLKIIFLLCALNFTAQAQGTSLAAMEDSLMVTVDSMYSGYMPELRRIYCEKFIKQLVRALQTPNSFEYDFPKLSKSINLIYPKDKSFRIFNWPVVVAANSVRYYGAIQLPGEQLKLYPLIDYSSEITSGLEDSVLTNDTWYGSLYYYIKEIKTEGQTMYMLIGKNENSLISNTKVFEPMYFTADGVKFGAPIFDIPGKNPMRFVLEYRKDVNVTMKWDEQYNAVTFDRLISQMNDPNRKYTFVPTGEYDGLKWQNGKWTLVKDIIPVQVFKDGEAPAPRPLEMK